MSGYPILFNVAQRPVLIVGGGAVAARKAAALLQADARVTIISPALHENARALLSRIRWIEVRYSTAHLHDVRPVLIFAATNQADVNRQVIADARAANVPVNAVDDAAEGDFSSMYAVERAPLTIALATGGQSPALLRHAAQHAEAAFGDEWGVLAGWLGELRQSLHERIPDQSQRADIYRSVVASDVLQLLRDGDSEAARQQFDALTSGEVLA